MTNLTNINQSTNPQLAVCINKFNQSLCRDRKTEIVHEVYDLGFDEIAEALGASIYGQTVNLKFLLGDYEVTESNNYADKIPKEPENIYLAVAMFLLISLITIQFI